MSETGVEWHGATGPRPNLFGDDDHVVSIEWWRGCSSCCLAFFHSLALLLSLCCFVAVLLCACSFSLSPFLLREVGRLMDNVGRNVINKKSGRLKSIQQSSNCWAWKGIHHVCIQQKGTCVAINAKKGDSFLAQYTITHSLEGNR